MAEDSAGFALFGALPEFAFFGLYLHQRQCLTVEGSRTVSLGVQCARLFERQVSMTLRPRSAARRPPPLNIKWWVPRTASRDVSLLLC